MKEVKVKWVGRQQYVATGQSGHSIVLDVSTQGGGDNTGPSATELLLMAVGKCSAVDVVNILRKQRLVLASLEVTVRGEISEDYPKRFTSIHVLYTASGDGITVEKVEKAAHLSHEKYCTVSNTLSNDCAITTAFEIV
jgi:putative redox protein